MNGDLTESVLADVCIAFDDKPGCIVVDTQVEDSAGGDQVVGGSRYSRDGGCRSPVVDVELRDRKPSQQDAPHRQMQRGSYLVDVGSRQLLQAVFTENCRLLAGSEP